MSYNRSESSVDDLLSDICHKHTPDSVRENAKQELVKRFGKNVAETLERGAWDRWN